MTQDNIKFLMVSEKYGIKSRILLENQLKSEINLNYIIYNV